MARTSLLRLTDCSSLKDWERCFSGASPSLSTLRRSFTMLLRYFFSDPDRLAAVDDGISCLVYRDSDTQISIFPGNANDPGDTNNVPGITISVGKEGVSLEKIGMDAANGVTPDYAGQGRSYTAKANLQFTCRAYDADVCCLIGDAVLMFLTAVAPILYRTFSWVLDYVPLNQTEPSKTSAVQTEDATSWYECIVSFSLTYNYSVFVSEESKRLKDYTILGTRNRKESVDF